MAEPATASAAARDVARMVAGSARRHPDRVAIVDEGGERTYGEVWAASGAVARRLLDAVAGAPAGAGLGGARVAILAAPGLAWAAACLGAWRAGGVAVPLCAVHPPPELDHVIADSGAAVVLAGPDRLDDVAPLAEARGAALVPVESALDRSRSGGGTRPDPAAPGPGTPAMILYTSGTTGRPKGVVLTRSNLAAQTGTLVEAWGWRADDRLVHALPLHHTHGIVNGLLCALVAGASCRMLPGFDAEAVWEELAEGRATMFFGVPTMYRRLVDAWDAGSASDRRRWSDAAGTLRLAVSGSAALPVPLFERWRAIAGRALLERYGMTEIGMALSNPLDGERRPGTVGFPLPGVDVRRVDADGRPIEEDGAAGEIEVRGAGVFAGYLDRPDETRAAFRGGWFATGDEAAVEDGRWRILGRRSVDIVKTGGEKVSALEVESALAGHPSIAECAVVGVPDPEWGERVCAAVVTAPGAAIDLEELRGWARERIAPWKVPSRLAVVEDLPRNAMGKVTKPAVRAMFESDERTASDEEEP